MPRIDAFLKTIRKLGAAGMTLQSDENIVLHFPDGDRHAVQKTAHADLADIVNEVAPPDVQAALYMEQPGQFSHEHDGASYQIEAQSQGGRLIVRLQPAAARPPVAPQPLDPAQHASQRQQRPGAAGLAPPAPPPAGIPPADPDAGAAGGTPQLADEDQDFRSLVEGNTWEDPAAGVSAAGASAAGASAAGASAAGVSPAAPPAATPPDRKSVV